MCFLQATAAQRNEKFFCREAEQGNIAVIVGLKETLKNSDSWLMTQQLTHKQRRRWNRQKCPVGKFIYLHVYYTHKCKRTIYCRCACAGAAPLTCNLDCIWTFPESVNSTKMKCFWKVSPWELFSKSFQWLWAPLSSKLTSKRHWKFCIFTSNHWCIYRT